LNKLQLSYSKDNQILESNTSKTAHKATLFSVLKLQYNRLQKSITHKILNERMLMNNLLINK
jgi:hypothetical protein